jgi:serine-type D-Ala-D-Ala carboxypeptidase (penicillin-binding protein 5/6)
MFVSLPLKNLDMTAAQKKVFQKMLKTSQVVLPVIALFIGALLFLLIGPNSLQKLDSKLALAQENQRASVALGEVAGVQKKPEIKIVSKNLEAPNFTGFAVLATDFDSNQVLFEHNSNIKYPPASTTKLMTALIAQDYFKPADVLTVTPGSLVAGSTMNLKAGEKLTYRSLLYGMLLDSGNDAAYTLAENYPGGVDNFVTQMNLKAQNLGLKNTHFQNPAGFDDPAQYASAQDLAQIAKTAASDYQLARIVATKQTTILSWNDPTASSSAHVVHNLKNLNLLLDLPGVIGMKTGTTEKAGENLVGLVERNGHKVITVMLGSKDRFGESGSLINWIYNNYQWVEQ